MKDLLFDRLHNGMGRVLDLRAQQSAMTAEEILPIQILQTTKQSSFHLMNC